MAKIVLEMSDEQHAEIVAILQRRADELLNSRRVSQRWADRAGASGDIVERDKFEDMAGAAGMKLASVLDAIKQMQARD